MPTTPPVSATHARHAMTPEDARGAEIPADARSGPEHAAELFYDPAEMARERENLREGTGGMRSSAFFIDRLEASFDDKSENYLWDAQGWYGGDIHRFWWKSEGDGAFDGELEEAELQVLYSRAITPYFDLQTGVRQTYRPQGDRTDIVVGLQGLAPYWFELDAAAFLSNEGELTAGAEAEYDLRLTQRWILQPRAEVSVSVHDIPEFDIAAGVTNIEAGARLRFEFTRQFAPYIGVEWTSAVGGTRDLIEASGEDPDSTRLILGVRTWF